MGRTTRWWHWRDSSFLYLFGNPERDRKRDWQTSKERYLTECFAIGQRTGKEECSSANSKQFSIMYLKVEKRETGQYNSFVKKDRVKKKDSITEWINRIKVWTIITFNKESTSVVKYEMWFHHENNHFELYTQDINFFSHIFVFLFLVK